MSTSLIDADSLLAIDVGSITTRVALFDVVDNRYRYLASGSAPTTVAAPYKDISEGIRNAIDQLQAITGRKFVADNERLIIPSSADGSGVDLVAATISAGAPMQVVVVGLLEDVSLESARRLAATTYTQVIDSISLNDRRKTEERIDTILRLRPDIILVAGGTDGGASRSVLKLLEAVGLANYLLPAEHKPEVLFAGNQSLVDELKQTLERFGPIRYAENIRPDLDHEQIEPAQHALVDVSRIVRMKQLHGVKELDSWAKGSLIPTATAFTRIVQYLSKIYDSSKGVLGVDVGASATMLTAGFAGRAYPFVYPELGISLGNFGHISDAFLEDVQRWAPIPLKSGDLRNHLHNKSLYPSSIPATEDELAIEQALGRVLLQYSWKKTARYLPASLLQYGREVLPWFEPIILSGSILTRSPNLAQSMLLALDGLQPTGITTIGLDQNHLLPMLGAAAPINPLLAVQVLETNCLLNLGTVIAPVGEVRSEQVALRLKLRYEGGSESTMDVKSGAIEVIPLLQGQSAELQIHPYHRLDVGLGVPGKSRRLRVVGGLLGVIIDARGRPLRLADDPSQRLEQLGKWRWMLGC
jgi:hypothetical protein